MNKGVDEHFNHQHSQQVELPPQFLTKKKIRKTICTKKRPVIGEAQSFHLTVLKIQLPFWLFKKETFFRHKTRVALNQGSSALKAIAMSSPV